VLKEEIKALAKKLTKIFKQKLSQLIDSRGTRFQCCLQSQSFEPPSEEINYAADELWIPK
jgi:hypothetical protein